MATNQDIVTRALRKISQVAGGGVPEAFESAEAMTVLAGLMAELIGQGTLGRLNDVIAKANYTAREFDRVRCDSAGITVTLPSTITQGSRAGAGGRDAWRGASCPPRPPRDLAPVLVVDHAGILTASFYSAYVGSWVTFNNGGLQDAFPLPVHYEDGFAALLAERVADEYGATIGPGTQRAAANCRYMLSHRYDSASAPVRTQYF